MTALITTLLIILIAGVGTLIYFQIRKKEPEEKQDDQSMMMMQEQLKEIRQSLQVQQGDLQKNIQSQFAQSSKIISQVTERLTKLDDTNKQVVGFAQQLQSLENILKNPKQRGILGEYFLETLLKNVFAPGQYQMQYKFKDGEIVDAVVFLKDKIIPVDSKFSLENYNKILEEKDPLRHEQLEKQFKMDLKNRIDETSKYIRPNENTTDFAFMFIPSEGIYYDLLVNQVGAIKVNTRDLIEYAFKDKKVIIVSPTSFYAYLQTVIQGLRYLQIEEQTQAIRKNVEDLGKHLLSYDEFMKRLGGQIGTTVNTYNNAYKEFKKIDKDIMRVSGTGGKIEIETIEKPQSDI
ncbi:DNA recombination protein RmuC [Candidatus Falkowbacteria bacterium]|nr:DNA recombination protein RmuC [Candidatus Falkowbacteria bacterium]